MADPSVVVREAIAAVDAEAAAAAAAGKPLPSPAERKGLLHGILEQKIGLRPEDVVMAVDGADVAGDGTVHFRYGCAPIANILLDIELSRCISLSCFSVRRPVALLTQPLVRKQIAASPAAANAWCWRFVYRAAARSLRFFWENWDDPPPSVFLLMVKGLV